MAAAIHDEDTGDQVTSVASFTNAFGPFQVLAGEGVVALCTWDVASTTTPTVVLSGGVGSDTLTLVYGPFISGSYKYAGWLLPSAGTGRNVLTVSWASSTPSFADAGFWSFSGLTNSVLDGRGFATGSTSPLTSADTATLLSADEFAVGFCATSTTVTSGDAPWTSNGATPHTGSWREHRILTATTPIHTNFTSPGTWITFCLTFSAAAAITPFTGYVFGVGQNSNPPKTNMVGY